MKKDQLIIDETNNAKYLINTYTFLQQSQSGPTIYIQANVHGAELQGNIVILELIKLLETSEIKSKITLVPNANPYATSNKMGTYTYGRFNPITGDNWNRMYLDFFKCKEGQGLISDAEIDKCKSNEDFKALIKNKISEYRSYHSPYGIDENKNLFITLQELASDADIVLDLHTAGIGCRYTYGPDYLEEEIKDLNFPFNLVIPSEFGGAMDEACFNPWINFHKAKGTKNTFESYTIELGSEELIDSHTAKLDAINIFNYLVKRDAIASEEMLVPKTNQVSCKLSNYKSIFAPAAGFIEYTKTAGDKVSKGEEIMRLYRFDNLDEDTTYLAINAQEDGYIINHSPSANVKKGMNIMEMFTKSY